ncbi:amidohydrolase family protein [Paludibaculum fermentans]|uniref:amidohydrolase family protein n=1 Tax=Paludibaculum fermentans TaxID=1473598 RepID=UPI003EBA90C0
MQRRNFLATLLPAAAASRLTAQPEQSWGGPVLDTHLHLRADADACFTHMRGCGVTNAVLLTPAADQQRAKAEMARRPGHFVRSVRIDPSLAESGQLLRDSLRDGAVSIGELKFHLALDSKEMRRVYDIAAEFQVPVMMHIQNFPHFAGELPYNTGYPEFDKVLRAYPRTTFIGHGDLFWAHISADVPTDRGYPAGPVKAGGLTDRWLSDFPNLYGDLSANSGNNALSRDPEFSRGFLSRHKTKLIFGSDCSCSDGNGAGVSQNNNPEASRLAGKCVARETLTLLQRLASSQVFRAVTWENGVKLFKVRT